MITKTVLLNISPELEEKLLKHHTEIESRLENKKPLTKQLLEPLFECLSLALNENEDIQKVVDDYLKTAQHTHLNLQHSDNRILNLPWLKARDKNKNELGAHENLFISKSLPGYFHKEEKVDKIPLPLKVLVMVSSPDRNPNMVKMTGKTGVEKRLSFEEEEMLLLRAFEPLIEKGLVEIDFSADASLDTLKRKLHENQYHIFHYSGHAIFDEEQRQGFLVMEDPVTMEEMLVSGQQFMQALNYNEQHRPPLVVISSCETAQGANDAGLRGISNKLMQLGIPAVVAMGWEISDSYASRFTAILYQMLAQKHHLQRAFAMAVEGIKALQSEMQSRQNMPVYPTQYMIPNLYLSKDCSEFIDWEAGAARLKLNTGRYLFFKEFLLEHDEEYLFIGRRKDKKQALPPLFRHEPVMLVGQGGVGKTAMAEHLVQRLIARGTGNGKDHRVFVFSEKNNSVQELITQLTGFLKSKNKFKAVRELEKIDDLQGTISHLTEHICEVCHPVFIFDNLENFQDKATGNITDEHRELEEVLQVLMAGDEQHIIITSRHKLNGDVFGGLHTVNLNHVPLNDFWKKCHYLEIRELSRHFDVSKRIEVTADVEKLDFEKVVVYLHDSFGGNYRALEFFSRKVKVDDKNIGDTLKSLETFREKYKDAELEVRQEMSKNLFFEELTRLLDPEQKQILDQLARFEIPVTSMALALQHGGSTFHPEDRIALLQHLTLVEIHPQPEWQTSRIYVTPLIKNLLHENPMHGYTAAFSHEQAGHYHLYAFHNLGNDLNDWEEAFAHFLVAKNTAQVAGLGDDITNFYYRLSQYRRAAYFGWRSYEFLGEHTPAVLLNDLGLISDMFGNYDPALNFYKQALTKFQSAHDKSGEGTTLNNISQIFQARGDYQKALDYLEQSLKIRREIGDKAGEGITLNNLATTAYAGGDYQKALDYLEQSLKIMREIGDIKGESVTLNNISQIFQARGDYQKALEYSRKDLEICRKIGEKAGEGKTLNNIGVIYKKNGDYAKALEYYNQSLKIRREIGDIKGESVTLNNISQIYDARGDYQKALEYSEKDLEICRKIGDKAGMIPTLHNLASIALQNQDIQKYVEYHGEAWQLAMETKDAMGLFQVGQAFGTVLCNSGMVKDGLEKLNIAYTIGQQSGLPGTEEIANTIQKFENQ